MNAYGSLYVHDGATLQATTSTPAKMVGFATAGPSSDLRDGDLSVVPVLASDHIAVKAGGIYRISFFAAISMSAAAIAQIHARFGATELANIAATVEAITAGADKVHHLSSSGFYVPATDGNISLYIETSASVNTTPTAAQLLVERIG